jgi:hypothetical protein
MDRGFAPSASNLRFRLSIKLCNKEFCNQYPHRRMNGRH